MRLAKREDIKQFVEEVDKVLGDKFDKAILYGSYAREEEDSGSDIDIAIIVSKEVDEDKIFKIADKYRFEKNLNFSPKIFKKQEFTSKVEEGFSFHNNVIKEGVEI